MKRVVLLLILLLTVACDTEHYLLGDSYLGLLAPYWQRHLGCSTHDLTQGARLAAQVLVEDIEVMEAQIALLNEGALPVVFLSAGIVDEAIAGPELAGLIVNALADRILAIRPDLELYHLDYRVENPPRFWNFTSHETNPRWHRVTFEGLLHGELSPDGIHLRTLGYIERLVSILAREPQITCRAFE